MSQKYIAIVGGELFNKGAQAMTFTVINEMKDKYPDAEILLLSSMDYERPSEEKERYNFEILRWSIKDKIAVLKGKNTELSKKLKKTFMMLDVSGFALSSQRGFKPSVQYLLNIEIAKKNKIPMYLMPQSFGPFNYSLSNKLFLNLMMKRLMGYPTVFAREEDGEREIKKYNPNVRRSFDIVLRSNKKYDLSKIYKNVPNNEHLNINEHAVAIVPNMKLFEHNHGKEVINLYSNIVEKLIGLKKNVYLLSHSSEDKKICEDIKKLFKNSDQVKLVKQELECTNVESVLEKMEFIIASRYHSIIHSYKCYTPAIVLGWAIKYKELLQAFSQEKYLFQIHEDLNTDKIIEQIEFLNKNIKLEQEKIKEKLGHIQQEDFFKHL